MHPSDRLPNRIGLLSVGFKQYGDRSQLETNAIMHLFDVYVKINSDASAEVKDHILKSREERRTAGQANVPANDAAPTREEEEAANAASSTHSAARSVFERMENGRSILSPGTFRAS